MYFPTSWEGATIQPKDVGLGKPPVCLMTLKNEEKKRKGKKNRENENVNKNLNLKK